MKTYGTIKLEGKHFHLATQPHVRARLKRLFIAARQSGDAVLIPNIRSNYLDLEMVLSRWPLVPEDESLKLITYEAELFRQDAEKLDMILAGEFTSNVKLLLEMRPYQQLAVELHLKRGRLLLGDELGLGKTVVGVGAFAGGSGAAVVVCQNHLCRQWKREFEKFLGDQVNVHIQTKGKGSLPEHHVLIIPYTMLSRWADRLLGYDLVIYDEVQELRRDGTEKYRAACALSQSVNRALALSATPVINYGDEIFNILNMLDPDCLGPRIEFLNEWCTIRGNHYMVKDPVALGTHIAENHLFLRRTRRDVKKELPEVTTITADVVFDEKRMESIKSQSTQLAQAILSDSSSWSERGQATRKLDMLLRQQTGIAKAPAAADAIIELVENGEKVLVTAWHREVWDIIQSRLEAKEIPSWMYTGTESPATKDRHVAEFIASEKPGVMLMSLGSGAGVNELQKVCSMVIHVELAWSRKIHGQATGRLNRDEQPYPVTEIFMVASGGSDPVVANILGLKEEQALGIVDPLLAGSDSFVDATDEVAESRGAALAREILKNYTAKEE